ncbi:MAG: hypothetical protein ACK55Z_35470, partial [bacterium]
MRTGGDVTRGAAIIGVAGADAALANSVAGARRGGIFRRTAVHAEGDVEAGHVVRHVAVEVEQHGAGSADDFRHTRRAVPVQPNKTRVDRLQAFKYTIPVPDVEMVPA